MNRHSITTRIFLPFVLTTLLFAVILIGVVPNRQASIVAVNTENELFSIAKTLALSVNMALEEEDLEALSEFNAFLVSEANISVAGIFIKKDDSFELFAAFPDEAESELRDGLDPAKFLVARAPFRNSKMSGHIEVGFSRTQFSNRLQAITINLYIAFVAILILQVIVYRIVQRGVITPILASIESANALGTGDLEAEIAEPVGRDEIAHLLRALIQLRERLKQQKMQNEELTSSLEHKVEARTAELSSALEALEGAQKTMNAVIDSSFDAIIQADSEGRAKEWNTRASNMFGLTKAQSLDKDMPGLLLSEESIEHFYVDGVFDPNPVRDELIELIGYSKSREKIDLEGFITALEVDHIQQWVIFLRDVTISKNLAEAIDSQRIVGSSVLDGLPISISLENRSGDHVLRNQAYQSLQELGFFETDLEEDVQIETTWRTGQSAPWDLVLSNSNESRSFICAMRIIEPNIPNQERYLLRYQVDVSELKKQESVLRKALLAKDEFMSLITHELRTPLHSIVASLDLIGVSQSGASQETEQYLSVAKNSSQTLLSLINELLEYQEILDKELQLQPSPFDVYSLFQQSRNMSDILFEESAVSFEAEFQGDEGICALGDERRITQLITNIIGNARKFTEEGRVLLIMQSQRRPDGRIDLHVNVKDTGIGMDQSTLTKLGEPFYQGTTGFSREFGGTGLGISIVKQILTAMNAELRVESASDVGSTFSFDLILPEVASLVEKDKEIEEKKAPRLVSDPGQVMNNGQDNRLKVLYVEDTDMNRVVMEAMMSRFSVELTMAESAKAGLTLARENNFDLIITDIQMPVHTGIELRQWLVEDDAIYAPKIIAFTANAETSMVNQYISIGFNDVLTKPLTLEKLGSFLEDYLNPVE